MANQEACVRGEFVPRVIDGLLTAAIFAAQALVALWSLPAALG
jgi:hypothetical protein